MKLLTQSLLLIACIACTSTAFAQGPKLLEIVPESNEEYVKSESAVINTINWLEQTPINEQRPEREKLLLRITTWVINSPTVVIQKNAKLTAFSKQNTELLIMFMAGWTRYCLQNDYSNDKIKCSVAGIRTAARVYKMGNGLKKDMEMEKLIDLDGKGELENWVKGVLEKK